MIKEYQPTREERREFKCTHSVYIITADKYNVITVTCRVKATTKEKATALCEKFNAKMNRGGGVRVKYVAISDDKELERLRAKADKVNATSIPKRNEYLQTRGEALRKQLAIDTARYQREREKELAYLKVTGFHYDNQQRVNEYKGTKRG